MLRAVLPLIIIFIGFGCGVFATGSEGDPRAIAGYLRRGGFYMPAEPYKDGQPRATSLLKPFPPMIGVARNPMTPEKVKLGRLLFFDPIVSGDNKISCAHCHHPDLGLADGRKLGMGFGGEGIGPDRKGGKPLARNTPSLWNVAYNTWQFWDGRVESLEEQLHGPITSADEMNEAPWRLVEELEAIPEYKKLFTEAFGDGDEPAITFANVIKAIASFERTLLSFNSKFDRYAAGDFDALNESEKRGMNLFRSLKTRCFECHAFPTMTDGTFRAIGVQDEGEPDLGRAATKFGGRPNAFRVPQLRNVELTAPYMHNGSMATLEEVVDFYAKGGGRQFPHLFYEVDDKIEKFDITEQETADLVAFMRALTDTSLLPVPPERVPSGLPVVTAKSRPEPAPPMPEPPAPAVRRTDGAIPVPGIAKNALGEPVLKSQPPRPLPTPEWFDNARKQNANGD